MPSSLRRPVEDFAAILRAISRQKDAVILVGGQAVNVWALTYKNRIGKALYPLLPFTSMDIDVYATRNALIELHHELGGRLLLGGPREVTEGTLVLGEEPDTRELDVLRSINGLSKLLPRNAIPMEVCGFEIQVLFPHLMLQAKLENALHLNQRGRQDVKHVSIMALVLHEFLVDVVSTATHENEKAALQLLQEVLRILASTNAAEFTQVHALTFDSVMPFDLLRNCPLKRLSGFARDQLPRSWPTKRERRRR